MLLAFWKPAAAMSAAALAAVWTTVAPTPLHAKPDLQTIFQLLDLDKNGAISLEEFRKHTANPEIRKLHEKRLADLHKGMAGSPDQHARMDHGTPSDEMLRSHFAKFDADADGSVKFAEFEAGHENMKGMHKAR